jgi:hypothetical protein
MEIINTFKQSIAKFSTAQPSSSVAKHKLPRDTNKTTRQRAIMTS